MKKTFIHFFIVQYKSAVVYAVIMSADVLFIKLQLNLSTYQRIFNNNYFTIFLLFSFQPKRRKPNGRESYAFEHRVESQRVDNV
jgi:hypothetical protein